MWLSEINQTRIVIQNKIKILHIVRIKKMDPLRIITIMKDNDSNWKRWKKKQRKTLSFIQSSKIKNKLKSDNNPKHIHHPKKKHRIKNFAMLYLPQLLKTTQLRNYTRRNFVWRESRVLNRPPKRARKPPGYGRDLRSSRPARDAELTVASSGADAELWPSGVQQRDALFAKRFRFWVRSGWRLWCLFYNAGSVRVVAN